MKSTAPEHKNVRTSVILSPGHNCQEDAAKVI